MYVAGVQLDIVWENKEANHAKVRSLLVAAKLALRADRSLDSPQRTQSSRRERKLKKIEPQRTRRSRGTAAVPRDLRVLCGKKKGEQVSLLLSPCSL